MTSFSNHMSYHEIADALHHAHLSSKTLSSAQWECLSQSLENPLTKKLLEFYPLPKSSKKVLSRTWEQLIAREPQREHNEVDQNVHSAIYGGEREKTIAYLKQTYPAKKGSDLMKKFRTLVREAVFENAEVKKELEISETDRYEERKKELIQTPRYSLREIQLDFTDYLNHLEQLKREGSTYGWDILNSLIQHYETTPSLEQKQEALFSLIRAVDDARTAYHASLTKYVKGRDYSCSKGFEERLIDHHQFLRPVEKKGPETVTEKTISALTAPFLSHDAAQEGCSATFSPALYQMYCEVAGYQIIKPEPIEIYALIEAVQHSDSQLEEQYLSSLKTSSPLSAQKEKYHRNQFRSLLSSIRLKSVLASTKTTPALKFLQAHHLIKITSHQSEETLEQIGPGKTEAMIFQQMIKRYPCFLGAAHLKLILTLHNLYGRFDGKFETYATFETLKKVAESGLISDSTAAIDSVSIRETYSQYLSDQEAPFYDFYPSLTKEKNNLTANLNRTFYQWPCSEEVLLQWMQNQEQPISLKRAQVFAFSAAKFGYTNALKVLLNPPYSVSPNYETPQERWTLLQTAIIFKHPAIVETLITCGAHVNHSYPSGTSSLIEATRLGQTDIVNALIHARAHVDHVTPEGHSALIEAAHLGYTDIVNALIYARADVNHVNQGGQSALMRAIPNGHTEIVQALIAAGADVNSASKYGYTALMFAADHRQTEIAQALIAAGANVNRVNQEGQTALLFATYKNSTEAVKALITGGADVNHVNKRRATALIIALSLQNREMIYLIIKAKIFVFFQNLMNMIFKNFSNASMMKNNQHSPLNTNVTSQHHHTPPLVEQPDMTTHEKSVRVHSTQKMNQ